MINEEIDVLIVGGGLIGAALMLALAPFSDKIRLVESTSFATQLNADFDARNIALSPASIRILHMLGIWEALESYACPIKTIIVSEEKGFSRTRLKTDNTNDALGYVVEIQHIHHVLHQFLQEENLIVPAQLINFDVENSIATLLRDGNTVRIKTKLLVAADGMHSSVRKLCGVESSVKDYQQHAVVANIGLLRCHQHIAYERFLKDGLLAFLPMNDFRSAMVWALSNQEVPKVMELNDREFLSLIQKRFGYHLGRFTRVGNRQAFPLQQVRTIPNTRMNNVVFIGNAANTLHPIAGQGFNLGLRDVAMLAQCIIRQGIDANLSINYQKLRQQDHNNTTCFTDGLIQLFSSKIPGLSTMRQSGLAMVEHLPLFKSLIRRYASGFSGVIPDLVCNIPLLEK